jgi:hypothetical protein
LHGRLDSGGSNAAIVSVPRRDRNGPGE